MENKLYLIGCGIPTPTFNRFGSCFVLQLGDECLMFDCGPASTYKLRRAGMMPTDISHLLFTHHHYDHNVDYPCFLLCRWDHENDEVPPLKVFGPPPTAKITERLIGPEGAFVDDWRARVKHPASQEVYAARSGKLPRPKPEFDVKEIQSGARLNTRRCQITAGTANHLQPLLECLSYRIDWDGGSVMITGDAGLRADLEKLAAGVSTIVVNVWDHQENMSPSLQAGFCGTLDAAKLAKNAGARQLVVAHQGPGLCFPGAREKSVADMAGIFKGVIIFGEELMELTLE